MEEIRRVAIIGMGALGLLYGDQITSGGGEACFIMDAARKTRHAGDAVTVNGMPRTFTVQTPEEYGRTADLLIIATKYSGLRSAAALAAPLVDAHTTIISVLNGINSELILAESFPREQIIDCVAIGMDAMRKGSALTYQNAGRLQIGISAPGQEERLAALAAFFVRTGMPHEVVADIRKAMWNKYMINVGINQTCMVHACTYGEATVPGPALSDMLGAMREVILVGDAEAVGLTEENLEANLKLLRGLNPDGYPSMRQDALAGRKSEVDLFAGTMVTLAAKHGLSVPVNEKYLRIIREMEA